jgi:hypothetical protein
MCDLVLNMDEVAPVMANLAAGGTDITALHNHLLRNQPFTMYMHVLGHSIRQARYGTCRSRGDRVNLSRRRSHGPNALDFRG